MPKAVMNRWPEWGDFWNVQRRLMSCRTNRTKIRQIFCNCLTLQVCSFYTETPIQALCSSEIYALLTCLWLLRDNNNTDRCVEIISEQTEDLSDQTGWAWEGVRTRSLWEAVVGGRGGGGGGLCYTRDRPMERRGPHAPADHNRGLIMSA